MGMSALSVFVCAYAVLMLFPLCRKHRNLRRNAVPRHIGVYAVAPAEEIGGGIRYGNALPRRSGKALSVFNDKIYAALAVHRSSAKVQFNGLQPVPAQRAGIFHFQNGAEAESVR